MAEMVLTSPPLQGELILIDIFPKGNIDEIEFPKGILEELASEYNLNKPKYSIKHVTGPPNNRRYDVECVVTDLINNNVFTASTRNMRKIKDGEHTTARKILKLLNRTYYFSEEEKEPNSKGKTYVMCQEDTSILKIKLFKWTNCCELCYQRGHVKTQCNGPFRNKKLFPNSHTKLINNDEFWEIPGKPITLKQENWEIPESAKTEQKKDSWDFPEAFFD